MKAIIAGGHGQIARRFARLIAERGDDVTGLIRNPGHAADLAADGAEPVVIDLERSTAAELAPHLVGADAVVFAAGAGPGSGVPRKDTVDRAAAALVADAAQMAGVGRYLLISAIGVDHEPPADATDAFAAYLRAKRASEVDLRSRDLDWTILRPGRLTDEPGTGRITLSNSVGRGSVPRDDVASVVLAMLDQPRTARMTLELAGGDVPIRQAVADALSLP